MNKAYYEEGYRVEIKKQELEDFDRSHLANYMNADTMHELAKWHVWRKAKPKWWQLRKLVKWQKAEPDWRN